MTTPTNSPVRAATSPELIKFRGDQAASLGIAIEHPTTVFSCRVNQSTFTDGMNSLTYDGGSGTLANIKEGMTIFVGSGAGLYDRLITRVRKTPTATVLYIAPTNAAIADNDYITVVDSFGLWQRDLSNIGGSILMDSDIEYGDVTRGGIIPRIGPLTTVINQTSGTITFTPPNPSLSAGYEDGVTVTGYTFAAPGASTTANMTSATAASWTYPLTANQEYRWSCAIVDSRGRTTTAYRRVFVNPTEVPFTLENCGASFDDGDWSFEVTNYADVSAIHPRAMVTLYARDYYGGALGSIGKLAGYENILAVGWIDGESVEQDSQQGTVSFTVRGAAFWLDKLRASPLELSDTTGPETDWKTINTLTTDKGLARLLYWTSTAPLVMDIFLSGNTDRVNILAAASSSLLSQVNAMADGIFARLLVNSYGQGFIQVDPQMLSSTARNALTTVMDITSADYEAPLSIERNLQGKTAMVELGADIFDGTLAAKVFSRAPGNAAKAFGDIASFDNYIMSTQADCNRLSGCLLAVDNNPYDALDVSMPANNRLIDIAPSMYCTITTSSASNPRGIALTAARLTPRSVSYSFDKSILRTDVSFEVEAIPTDGENYYPPTPEDANLDSGLGDFGGVDFPAFDTSFPPVSPPTVTAPCADDIANAYSVSFSPRTLTGGAGPYISKAYFPCWIHASGGLLTTSLTVGWNASGDAISNFSVFATMGGARVLTGTVATATNGGFTAVFSPLTDTEVDGFEVELDAGENSGIVAFDTTIPPYVRDTGGQPTTLVSYSYPNSQTVIFEISGDNPDLYASGTFVSPVPTAPLMVVSSVLVTTTDTNGTLELGALFWTTAVSALTSGVTQHFYESWTSGGVNSRYGVFINHTAGLGHIPTTVQATIQIFGGGSARMLKFGSGTIFNVCTGA